MIPKKDGTLFAFIVDGTHRLAVLLGLSDIGNPLNINLLEYYSILPWILPAKLMMNIGLSFNGISEAKASPQWTSDLV